MSKTWGFFFGGSEHGPESSCQISAYYKFFLGSHVFCRISTGLLLSSLNYAKIKKKQCGPVLSVHNSLLYLQSGPKVCSIVITVYSAIAFF